MIKYLGLVISLFVPNLVLAAVPGVTGNTFVDGVVSTLVYGLVGIFMAFFAMKLIDLATPGDLGKQIGEDRNVAMALLVGCLILGICIIIAAAIAG